MASVARPRSVKLSPPVWRILLHSLIYGLALSIADLLFNFYLVSLGYDTSTVGLFSTVGRAAGMLMGIPIGLLIDRSGPQRAMLIGVALYALGWVFLLQVTVLWALVAAQFVVGAAYLLASTAVTPLLASITDDAQRATVFGLNASATLIIGLLGSAVGGLLPGLAASVAGVAAQSTPAYRLALAAVVGLSVLALLPVLGALPALPEGRDGGVDATPEQRRLPLRRLVRYALPAMLLGMGSGAILPFQNLFFRERFLLDDAAVGVALAWAALGMGLGALIGSPVAAKLGLRRSAALLRVGALPAMLLMLVPALTSAAVGFLLRGLFVAASYPLNDALVMRATPPRQRGAAMSVMSVLWAGGWAWSAALCGWLNTLFDSFAPLVIIAALAYLASAVAIFTMPLPEEAQG